VSTLTTGQRLGPYEVAALIGSGGMGEVYEAHDTRLNRTVAIKVSREQFSERFEREARAIAALNHPNICTLYDVGSNYLVMELVEGPTLADRIAEGPIPVDESLHIARQIGTALDAAHEQGIVHRDLKPANIKIKTDGLVKVLDFGLAKVGGVPAAAKSEDSPTISMAATQAGVILGTAAYMSPEQARGKPVDKRADVWAFGVVLHEMLTGRRLFQGEDATDTLASVIKAEPTWDGIPANVQRLLGGCLEKDPRRRLRDIGDAWRLLDAPAVPAGLKGSSFGWIGMAAGLAAGVAVTAIASLALLHWTDKPASLETVRFQIYPPEKGAFSGSDALLSPDGRRLAFRIQRGDGRMQLWVHSFNSLESKPLAGTEGVANASFWSPDSRSLGFVAEGILKKVDVSGGPTQRVCTLPNGAPGATGRGSWREGAWSGKGVILFGTADGGLFQVSDEGGSAVPVTSVDRAREAFHAGPSFLPDGRRFLYHRSGPHEAGNVYLGSLDLTPEKQSPARLWSGMSGALYVPGAKPNMAYVIFTREGTLMAQPVDARRLTLIGEAVTIAEGLGEGGPRTYSASMTGALAYRTGVVRAAAYTETQLTWFDRTGKVLGTAGEPGGYNSVALSPDGTRVAVSRVDLGAARALIRRSSDIWIHEFARGISTRLTSNPAVDWLAAWSPDGSRVIFSSDRDGAGFDLYQKVASGAGNDDVLFKSRDTKCALDWSRDGRFLLYSVADNGRAEAISASHDLWVLPLTPKNPSDIKPRIYLQTEFNESQARFSPDGHFIAYGSDSSGRDEVYVRPFPAANDGKWTISTGGGLAPQWRADGRELFYISTDSKMMSVQVSTDPVFEAGMPKVLFEAPVWAGGNSTVRTSTRYDVTADGRRFLINSIRKDTSSAATPITVVLNWTAVSTK
jgi:eukaryotic-like serine/threonine-protein kinase